MRKEKTFIISSQKQLDILLDEWMKVLHLNDWEIYATFATKDDLGDVLGDVKYNTVNKQACIRILISHLYDDPNFEWDMEETLVHELLHIVLDCIEKNEVSEHYHYDIHILVESLARSFVKAKRRCLMPPKCRKCGVYIDRYGRCNCPNHRAPAGRETQRGSSVVTRNTTNTVYTSETVYVPIVLDRDDEARESYYGGSSGGAGSSRSWDSDSTSNSPSYESSYDSSSSDCGGSCGSGD